jgi:uncharacterized protein (TIGR00645 family)
MRRFQHVVEAIVVNSRWLLAPFLVGLAVGLVALLYTFLVRLADLVGGLRIATATNVIVGILSLVDITLGANLIIIVICSVYENFMARIDLRGHPDLPAGLSKIRFAGLEQKIFGSLVAIAAVYVLEWFIDIEHHAEVLQLAWLVGIMIAFALAKVLTAVADRLSNADQDT